MILIFDVNLVFGLFADEFFLQAFHGTLLQSSYSRRKGSFGEVEKE
jgi:hypothetical protein